MITEYKIFEAKQVGIIYHWCDLYSLKSILESDKMCSWRGFISFSRNKNLNFDNRPVKITFDGNKMSHRFRFEPFLYCGNFGWKDEAEERIKCNIIDAEDCNNYCIKDIKKYITNIEIEYSNYLFNNKNYDIEKELEEIQKLTDVIIKTDIEEIKKAGLFGTTNKFLVPQDSEIKFESINEAKQVGILYHWTKLSALENILKDNRMWSSMGYISFSRNKRLNFDNRPVLIIFDGNSMSNKFKFEPHMYMDDLRYKHEAEEKIECDHKTEVDSFDDCILGVKKYIIKIIIDLSKHHLFMDNKSNPNPINIKSQNIIYKKINNLQKSNPEIKIEIINDNRI